MCKFICVLATQSDSVPDFCHRFIAGACARRLHIPAVVGKRAQPNAVLEKVFTSITKVRLTSICFKEVFTFVLGAND